MGRSNYNIHFLTTADLSALQRTTREINASATATGAVEKFNQRLAQYEYDRLSTAEKINRLKRDEQALLLAGRQRFEAGDEAGSAQLNTAALNYREQIERLVTQQKQAQAQLAEEIARKDARTAAAQARFQAQLEEYELSKLSLAEQINAAHAEEVRLLEQAQAQTAAGDAEGAAESKSTALAARLQMEQLMSQEKRQQAALENEQQRQERETAAVTERAENARQQRLETTRAKLAALQRQQQQEAFAALAPEDQLKRLVAQRESLLRKINEHGERYRRNQQTQLAVQLRMAQLDTQIRAAQARADASRKPGVGDQFKTAVGGVAAQFAAGFGIQALVGRFLGATRELFQSAGNWSDMADRIGVTTETIQEFEIAAGKSGASLNDVATAFRGVRSAQARAQSGNEAMQKSFQALGFTTAEIKSLSPEQIFRRIAEEAGKGGQGVLQTRAAMDILGRSSDQLLTAFRSGFSEAAANARDAGAIIEEDIVRQLDLAAKNSNLLGKQLKAAFAPLVAFFAGFFSTI